MLSINKQNFCSLTVQMGWTQRVAVTQLHIMTTRKWVFYLDSSVYLGRIIPKIAWEHKTGHIRRIKFPLSLIFSDPQQINKKDKNLVTLLQYTYREVPSFLAFTMTISTKSR